MGRRSQQKAIEHVGHDDGGSDAEGNRQYRRE
jgi:hypothetical protein